MWIMDPFERLVTEAKDRLSEREGREISWRELARRAGYDDGREWGVFRNAIRPQRDRRSDGQRAEGRRPNPEVVRRLAKVLPVTELELNRAAAATAGYTAVTTNYDALLGQVLDFIDDESLTEEEREARAGQILQVLKLHGSLAPSIEDSAAEAKDQLTEGAVVEFPRRRYLAEAGAAARAADSEQDLSDPDGTVDQ